VTAATLKATPANMPTIEIGGISYPVFFSILAQEKWAEHVDRPIKAGTRPSSRPKTSAHFFSLRLRAVSTAAMPWTVAATA